MPIGRTTETTTSYPTFKQFPGVFGTGLTPEQEKQRQVKDILMARGGIFAEAAGRMPSVSMMAPATGVANQLLDLIGTQDQLPAQVGGFDIPGRTAPVALPGRTAGYEIPGQVDTGAFAPGVGREALPGGPESVYSEELRAALLDPTFGPQTASEEALIENIMDITAGRGAVRGLGAPTTGALAVPLAPTLVGMRQQEIENLMAALQGDIGQQLTTREQDIGFGLGQRAQDVTQRGQTLDAILAGQGMDVTQRSQTMAALSDIMRTGTTERGQEISALLTSMGIESGERATDIATLADIMQGGIAQRATDIGAGVATRGMDLQALLELSGLAMPQIVGGQVTEAEASGWNIGF